MTPAQIEEAARRRYNAVGDTFFSQDELFKVIWEAEQELALEAYAIEGKDTSISTVAGTRTYSMPSLYFGIKRVEYDGVRLHRIDDRDDDLLTLSNSTTTDQGSPLYYWLWNDVIYLRPIPDAVKTLTIYGYKEATLLTTASTTLSVPTRCHSKIINYVAAIIAAKDENFQTSDRFMNMWREDLKREIAFTRRKKRTDSFASVKDEDAMALTILGAV